MFHAAGRCSGAAALSPANAYVFLHSLQFVEFTYRRYVVKLQTRSADSGAEQRHCKNVTADQVLWAKA